MTGRAADRSPAGGTTANDGRKERLPGDPDLKPARHDITVDELHAAFPQWHIVQRLGRGAGCLMSGLLLGAAPWAAPGSARR